MDIRKLREEAAKREFFVGSDPMLDALIDEVDELTRRCAEYEAEITRHHRDFERWETIADNGARQIDDNARLRKLLEGAANDLSICGAPVFVVKFYRTGASSDTRTT